MNNCARLVALLLSSTLAACGGGGSGGVMLTPTLDDEITGQPVAQDQSTVSEAIQNGTALFQRAQFSVEGANSALVGNQDFGLQLVVDGTVRGEWTSLEDASVDAAQRRFTVRLETPAKDVFVFVNAANDTPTPSFAAPQVADSLDYSTYGVWLMGDEQTPGSFGNFENTTDLAAFFGGIVTVIDGMPTTGQATYSGGAIAAEFNSATKDTTILLGSADIAVNFASQTLTGEMALSDGGSTVTRRIALSDGLISGNTFSASASTAGLSGGSEGVFMGPDAAELAGEFSLTGDNTVIRGAFGTAR